MFILCDTSSILMLLRIAPDMFKDERFQCKTIREIHDEIVQTNKFKTKYPWIKELRTGIRSIILNEEQKVKEKEFFEAIKLINDQGTKNLHTGRFFDLSRIDMRVLSHALTLDYKITSCDGDLVQFGYQEFGEDFKGNVFPLEIIIIWLESSVIQWSEEKQIIIREWIQNEPSQPEDTKRKFKKITGNLWE